ncbi:hypothetical protein IB231_22530 [Pantoea sp. PNT02]|uniref:hypothetical protein n=1 Tax=Pantoea sp. PNT02 TaxID=2769261 RepID=UPI0017815DF8|nr:hypothetical protein [Pantoea sp. PNT02]MBD9646400.1 hypothetical protein [Pantoea sp. PNT02]
MTVMLGAATAIVALMMLFAWLPEIREPGLLLRRWSRGSDGHCSAGICQAVDDVISGFVTEHNLPEVDTSRLREMKSRPAMMPVTLLLHPQLVKRENGRFVRGRKLTAVMVATGISALILPPLAGMALHDVSLSLLPLLNMVVFFTGVQLVRQTYSDLSLINVLVTGKPD